MVLTFLVLVKKRGGSLLYFFMASALIDGLIKQFENTSDPNITYNTETIISFKSWQQQLELGQHSFKGGEGSIYITTPGIEHDNKHIEFVTKVYKYDTYQKCQCIFNECKVFTKLKLLNYYSIAYGPNENEIYLTMKKLFCSLPVAIKHYGLFYNIYDSKLMEHWLKDLY